LDQEIDLPDAEQKTYVYVAFDIQRFFPNFLAKKMPHALDQNRVDTHFLEEICRVNRHLFGDDLHEYMIRYLIMFFDHEYDGTSLLDDFAKNFIHGRRFFRPAPPEKTVSIQKASGVFGVKTESLADMTPQELTRKFRQLAQKYHPDKGGSDERFVELTRAYQCLLRKIRNRG